MTVILFQKIQILMITVANQPFRRKVSSQNANLSFENSIQNGKVIISLLKIMEKQFVWCAGWNFQKTENSPLNDILHSSKRATEIVRLKDGIAAEKKIVRKFLDKNEVLTCASYQIAFNLAKSAKPYTDGEFYKSLLQSTISTLCTNLDEKMKEDLLDKVRLLPISGQTISRRVHDLSTHIETKLKNDLQKCHSFSIALDETTDIRDMSQLIFWVRYVVDVNTIGEELLALAVLKERTRAIDLFNEFLSVVNRFDLDLRKLISICTDGAPAMVGQKEGFVAKVQKHMHQKGIDHKLISYHCILHQENLCAKAIEGRNDVLHNVTEVNKLHFFT